MFLVKLCHVREAGRALVALEHAEGFVQLARQFAATELELLASAARTEGIRIECHAMSSTFARRGSF